MTPSASRLYGIDHFVHLANTLNRPEVANDSRRLRVQRWWTRQRGMEHMLRADQRARLSNSITRILESYKPKEAGQELHSLKDGTPLYNRGLPNVFIGGYTASKRPNVAFQYVDSEIQMRVPGGLADKGGTSTRVTFEEDEENEEKQYDLSGNHSIAELSYYDSAQLVNTIESITDLICTPEMIEGIKAQPSSVLLSITR